MVIPASSTEYVHVPVTAPAGVSLTGAPVRIAIVAHNDNPSGPEWHDAEWAASDARILVGPDSGMLTLSRGDYRVWISVDPTSAENIVRMAGYLSVA